MSTLSRWSHSGVATAGVLALLAIGLAAPNTADASPVDVIWRDGLRFQSSTDHGDVLIRFGGRLHFDAAFGFSELDDDASDHAFEPRDGYRIRRARFDLRGTLYDVSSFRLQLDFAGGNIAFADAYLGFKVGPGTITVGQKRAHFSLVNLMSSNDLPMMEAPFVTQLFSPGRQLGLGYEMNALDNLLGLAVGFYRLSTGTGTVPNPNEWLLSGRVWASLMNDNDDMDLHVGASFNHFILQSSSRTFATRGAIRTEPSGGMPLRRQTVDLDSNSLLGFEAAFVMGAVRIIAEFAGAMLTPSDADDDSAFLWAISATAGYVIGGNQRYSAGSGYLLNPRGGEPVGGGGMGLFEVVMHFDYGDLADGLEETEGASALQVALGLNWYLNNNMRIMWDFALINVDGDGTYYLMGMRFQVGI